MPTKCIKLEITPSINKTSSKEVFKYIRDMQYSIWKASNRAMMMHYQEDMRIIEEKEYTGDYTKDKALYGCSFQNVVSRKIIELTNKAYASGVTDSQNQFVKKRYGNDKKEIFKGNKTLSTFKRNIPIQLHNRNIKLETTELNGVAISITLMSSEEKKKMGYSVRDNFNFLAVNPDNSSKAILNRIISGEYKQGSCQLMFNKKGKLMLVISYTFERKQEVALNPNRIMGIDLGITKVAVCSVFDTEQGYIRTSWKESILDGKELIVFRQKLEARRRSMSIATKWASENKTGHGYKQRTRDANALSDKVARFRDTYNHKVSRYIVDMALKYKCSVIQLEDLSGFTEKQSESLLRNWSYYDLQQKIKYKAEEVGIVVNFIDPKFTSKRCNKCGCIHINNRDCKNNQAKFECVKCGHKDNADINASKNIALPNIESLIKEYLHKEAE